MITIKRGKPEGKHDAYVSMAGAELEGKVNRDDEGNLVITVDKEVSDGYVVITTKDEHGSCYSGTLKEGVFQPCIVPSDYKTEVREAFNPKTEDKPRSVPISESIDFE